MGHARAILGRYRAFMDALVDHARLALLLIAAGIPLSHLSDGVRDNVYLDPRSATLWLGKLPVKGQSVDDQREEHDRIVAENRTLQECNAALGRKTEQLRASHKTLSLQSERVQERNDTLVLETRQLQERNAALMLEIGQLLPVAKEAKAKEAKAKDDVWKREVAKLRAKMRLPRIEVPTVPPFPRYWDTLTLKPWFQGIEDALTASNHVRLLNLKPVAWVDMIPGIGVDLANRWDKDLRRVLLAAMGRIWVESYSSSFPTATALYSFIKRTCA
ncbi:hypothetical protein GGF32_006597 [Allomyces javanicus]|nr:hypothetical protein GGF32_006597 [Allomyces javanicus]